MTNQFLYGTQCLLDEKHQVTVLKPATRSNSSYSIDIPGRRIETVARERLTTLPSSSITTNTK